MTGPDDIAEWYCPATKTRAAFRSRIEGQLLERIPDLRLDQ